MEKIFANYISDMGLAHRIYRELKWLNNKRQISQFKNGQSIWIDISPEKINIPNKHMIYIYHW